MQMLQALLPLFSPRRVVAGLIVSLIPVSLFGASAITGSVTNATAAGPTMSTESVVRGLNLITTSGQFQRQNIATVNNFGYSWIGQDSITYALTIGSYPGPAYPGFQTHIFLVPGATVAGSAPDYSEPHVVFLDIQPNGAGGAFAAFRYKTNEPGANAFLYGPGSLGGVFSSSYTGRWLLTFTQDTNVSVTAPDGGMGTFILPAEAAALFAEPVTVYIGAQANAGGNIGQAAVINRFEIATPAGLILASDFFVEGHLDSDTWRVDAGDPQGVQVVGSDAGFWLNWTIPDSGFVLQASPDNDSRSWYTLQWTVPLMGSRKRVLVHKYTDTPEVNKAYMPDPGSSFFRLIKF